MGDSISAHPQVQHDNTVTWLAHWKENVNNQAKYVFLSAGSAWKGQSDRAKFEKARELIVSLPLSLQTRCSYDRNTSIRSEKSTPRSSSRKSQLNDKEQLRCTSSIDWLSERVMRREKTRRIRSVVVLCGMSTSHSNLPTRSSSTFWVKIR